MSSDAAGDEGMFKIMAMVGAALVVFTLVCVTAARLLGIGGYDEEDALMTNALLQRIEPVGQVRTEPFAEEEPADDQVAMAKTPQELYDGACAACHAAGVAGAPKLDDDAAWAERREAGLDMLVASVVNGKGGMPARGGSTYTDDQITLAVQFMAGFEIEEAAPAEDVAAADAEPAAEDDTAPAEAAEAEAPAEDEAAAEEEAPAEDEAVAAEEEAPAEDEAVAAAEGESPAEDDAVASADEEAPPADDAAAGGDVDLVALIGSGQAPEGMEDVVKTTVDGVCSGCHLAGVAGAPITGDVDSWSPRAEMGLAALTATVISGKGAMPPKGGSTLTDEQIAVAVQYLISKQP